jgi:hypothetical protein
VKDGQIRRLVQFNTVDEAREAAKQLA